MIRGVACAVGLFVALSALPALGNTLAVGSKRFTESYILGEIVARTARESGVDAVHKQGLGNTGIVFQALNSGAIDVYPDYTGTIAREILKLDGNPSLEALNAKLAPMGLAAGIPLGFNNSYALAMREDEAAKRGIRTLSDLAAHPDLKLGLSQEFIGRADGWPGLARAYALPHRTPSGLDHGLAYEAIAAGRIDVMDIYSTDAKIERFGLRVLEDDRGFFPRYEAVLVYRADVPARFPQGWAALAKLAGTIDARRMIRLNAAAELQGATFAEAASLYFPADPAALSPVKRSFWQTLFGGDFWKLTREHLLLTFASLAASVAVGIPLGVLAARVPRVGQIVLGIVSVVQTIPSLALLAFLIAITGRIGVVPALIALFLYALLPIVRNTHAGLVGVSRGMRQAAVALGLSAKDRLVSVELPLATPSILAGIKTSAVINVGTATIAAFVGAGGYGERIVQGLALNDSALMLAGALPAAALALLVQWSFDAAERRFSPLARAQAAGR
ncbi:MAG: ABC transporter permease subunit [Burkholderiales bacterium]|jgi:osmoprotectant transport system permease protein|nr:ABC transporter permease subunit [Burkholderiales bacterium]